MLLHPEVIIPKTENIAISNLAGSNVRFSEARLWKVPVIANLLGEKDPCLILVLFLSCPPNTHIHKELTWDLSGGTTAAVVSAD